MLKQSTFTCILKLYCESKQFKNFFHLQCGQGEFIVKRNCIITLSKKPLRKTTIYKLKEFLAT